MHLVVIDPLLRPVFVPHSESFHHPGGGRKIAVQRNHLQLVTGFPSLPTKPSNGATSFCVLFTLILCPKRITYTYLILLPVSVSEMEPHL